MPLMRKAALLSPSDVAAMDLGEVTVKLAKNGYSRGLLTSMYGERLQAVMRAVVAGTLDVLPELVRSGQQDAFTRTLTEIHGVGPKVAANAWEFLSAVERETTPSKDQPGAN
jgi:3-methyladenine DNA glycosylase/8-oxoguanine DNA glycosylase